MITQGLKIVWSSQGAKAPEKMHLAPEKWAAWCWHAWSYSQSQTSSWYPNDFLWNSSSAIANCFRMEACLEPILASQWKSLFSTLVTDTGTVASSDITVNTYIVQSGRHLKHSCQETSREGEGRHPEDHRRMSTLGPLEELIHTCYQVPGPGCKRFHGWVGLERTQVKT
jgi:hypothetical protein